MNGDQHEKDKIKPRMNAVDIIRTLDSAHAEMSTNAVSACRDAEEARKNARVASAVARRYTTEARTTPATGPASPPSPTISHGKQHQQPQIPSNVKHRPPPPPPPPRIPNPLNVNSLESQGSISYDNLSSDKKTVVESVPRTPVGSYTPTERLSHTNAEDMLAIALELERTKQSLEYEMMMHEDTKSALEQSEEKNSKLQNQIDLLLNELETQRQKHGLAVESLERELEKSRLRVESAEEDAEVALGLAKANAESKQQLEAYLQLALHENETLREHILTAEQKRDNIINGTAKPTFPREALSHAPKSIVKSHSPHRVVRFADDSASSDLVETPSRPTRKLVAAGRQILHRSLAPENDASPVHKVIPPQLSADRLRQLRTRLVGLSVPRPPPPPPPPRIGPMRKEEMVAKVQALDICHNTAQILKESGKRLQLMGKFFNGKSSDVSDDIHLEALARHYCAAVEISFNHQKKEILELESLVSLWEKSMPSDTES